MAWGGGGMNTLIYVLSKNIWEGANERRSVEMKI
jgi:hypothetical protein